MAPPTLPTYRHFFLSHLVGSLSTSGIILVALAVPFVSVSFGLSSFFLGLFSSLSSLALVAQLKSLFPKSSFSHIASPSLHAICRALALNLSFSLDPRNTHTFSRAYSLASGAIIVFLLHDTFQLFRQLPLYSDILPSHLHVNLPSSSRTSSSSSSSTSSSHQSSTRSSPASTPHMPSFEPFYELEMPPEHHCGGPSHIPDPERDNLPQHHDTAPPLSDTPFERLADLSIRQRERESLDAYLGIPFPYIPTFLFSIWRLDTTLLHFIITLFLALSTTIQNNDEDPLLDPNILPFSLALLISILCHTFLSYIWSFSLPRYGFAKIGYATLLTLLLLLCAILEAWGVLF